MAARRDAAAEFGATDAVDPTSADVTAEVMRLTGVGVDYAFDAAGRAALVETGLWATRNGGLTVIVGAAPTEEIVSFPPVAMLMTEKKIAGTLLGSSNSTFEIPRLLGPVAGRTPRPRGDGDGAAPAERDQRGHRRHARRTRHPLRPADRA